MDDGGILALVRDGRLEEAFTQIVNLYSERLYWHIRTIVGTHEDADDVVQDSFIKIWNALPSFRGEAQLFTWVWRIATNEAINHARREKLRTTRDIDSLPERGGSSGVDGDEAQRLLSRAIETLSPRQRAVFSMRYFDQMPYEQISRITGTSVGALKASYHFAENKVRTFISNHFHKF